MDHDPSAVLPARGAGNRSGAPAEHDVQRGCVQSRGIQLHADVQRPVASVRNPGARTDSRRTARLGHAARSRGSETLRRSPGCRDRRVRGERPLAVHRRGGGVHRCRSSLDAVIESPPSDGPREVRCIPFERTIGTWIGAKSLNLARAPTRPRSIRRSGRCFWSA